MQVPQNIIQNETKSNNNLIEKFNNMMVFNINKSYINYKDIIMVNARFWIYMYIV
jgi:hypothetical protein